MRHEGEFVVKLLMSVFIALNVWLYRVSGGRMMGRMGAAADPSAYDDRAQVTTRADGTRPVAKGQFFDDAPPTLNAAKIEGAT